MLFIDHGDSRMRVHGLQNLRVINASIMPRMISANLNASTMMIADKASDLIRGKRAPEAAVGSIAGWGADPCWRL
jgi:choline dehydrogenase